MDARVPGQMKRFLIAILFIFVCTPLHAADSPPPHVQLVNGKFTPDAGYVWLSNSAGDYRVRWSPGTAHPTVPHVVAGATEGK